MLNGYGLHQLTWDTCDERFGDVLVASPADARGRGISLAVRENGAAADLVGATVYFMWEHKVTDERGDFDGADGVDGADGFSPTATVTQTADGATITITDKNGTTTADVAKGAKGDTGCDGVDATISGASATMDSSTGTPSASITLGGTASARTFAFAFHNPRALIEGRMISTVDFNQRRKPPALVQKRLFLGPSDLDDLLTRLDSDITTRGRFFCQPT